jgi:hypothetical protein
MTKETKCVDCKAIVRFVFRTFDGQPRCGRCHVRRVEEKRRSDMR